MSWYAKPFVRTTKTYHSLKFHAIYWSIYCCRFVKLYLGFMHAIRDCTYIVCVRVHSCIMEKVFTPQTNSENFAILNVAY